jgi:hypothetical protein
MNAAIVRRICHQCQIETVVKMDGLEVFPIIASSSQKLGPVWVKTLGGKV